jgi:hypothetical protein
MKHKLPGNHFILPAQPHPKDKRPRNAFGFLTGFGKAYKAFYEERDKTMKLPKKPLTIREQYDKAKAVHPDMLLLFRIGDSYQLFGEDAKTAARVLGLTVTCASSDESWPMAGVPHHQLEGYLQKLIREGFKVAICEQVQY